MKRIALLVLFAFGTTEAYAQKQALKTNLLYDLTTTVNLGYEVALDKKITLDLGVNYNPWTLGYKWVGIEGTESFFNAETGKNPFVEKREKKMKHWMVQPEIRWWLCEKFNGHFFGVHLHGGQFNVGAMTLPFGIGRYKYEFTPDVNNVVYDQFGQPAHQDKNWGDFLGRYPVKIQTGDKMPDGSNAEVSGVQYKQGTVPYRSLLNYMGETEAENQKLYANADRDGIYANSFEGWLFGTGVSYGYHWILTPRFSLEFTLGIGVAYLDYKKTRCTDCRQVIGEDASWYFGPTRAGLNLVWMLK